MAKNTVETNETTMVAQVAKEVQTHQRFFSSKLNEAQKGALAHVAAIIESNALFGTLKGQGIGDEFQKAGIITRDQSDVVTRKVLNGTALDIDHARLARNGAFAPKAGAVVNCISDILILGFQLPAQPRLLAPSNPA